MHALPASTHTRSVALVVHAAAWARFGEALSAAAAAVMAIAQVQSCFFIRHLTRYNVVLHSAAEGCGFHQLMASSAAAKGRVNIFLDGIYRRCAKELPLVNQHRRCTDNSKAGRGHAVTCNSALDAYAISHTVVERCEVPDARRSGERVPRLLTDRVLLGEGSVVI